MIRVTKGTVGYWDGRRIVPLTAKSGAVRLRPDAERRFVELGVAEYVDTDGSLDDVADESMSTKDLREIAKSRGITFKVGLGKKEMVDILNSGDKTDISDVDESSDNESGEDESDAPDAPSFDAVDSVR